MNVRRFASLLVASGSLATGAVRATDTTVPDMEYDWRDSSMTVGAFANRESRSGLLQTRFESQLTASARLLLSYIEYWEYAGRDVGFFDRSIEARVRFSF